MQLEELVNEYNFRKCRGPENATDEELLEAFVFFCNNYAYIKHPNQGRIQFNLRDAQIETAKAWIEKRYTIVLKSRQIGFSTLAAAYAFWLTFFQPDRFVVMLSKTEREATKLLGKTKYIYKFLPDWMKMSGPELIQNNVLKMVFDNESVIESLPSANEPARGESVYLAIIDEMAFLPNPEEAWASIEPIADVGGRVICIVLVPPCNGRSSRYAHHGNHRINNFRSHVLDSFWVYLTHTNVPVFVLIRRCHADDKTELTPRLANPSARSFSTCPACPFTQCHTMVCSPSCTSTSSCCQRSAFLTGCLAAVRQPLAFQP